MMNFFVLYHVLNLSIDLSELAAPNLILYSVTGQWLMDCTCHFNASQDASMGILINAMFLLVLQFFARTVHNFLSGRMLEELRRLVGCQKVL